MATVNQTQSGVAASHVSPRSVRQPYMLDVYVKASEVATTKGSALALADVIQILDIPAESLLLGGGIEIVTPDSGSDILVDMGIEGSVDILVDGGDLDAASAGDYLAAGTNGAVNFSKGVRITAADTVDLVLGQTAAFNSGDDWEMRAYVILLDISGRPEPVHAT